LDPVLDNRWCNPDRCKAKVLDVGELFSQTYEVTAVPIERACGVVTIS